MADRIKVGFPGLGIDEFELSSVAIRNLFGVEGFSVRWYAVFICLGICLAFVYFLLRGKRTEKLLEDDLLNVTLLAVPLGIVGARFLYVITNLDQYDTFMEMINIREGGVAVYGSIIFGAGTIIVYSLIKKHNCLKYFDAIAPAMMIGQIIGRWGNFMNGEAYGLSENVDTNIFRMTVQRIYSDGSVGKVVTAHPTFLYESLWNLVGFILINIVYKKKKFDGQIVAIYVAWYGFGRAWIEMLRSDSLYVGNQKLMVWLGFITCAAAVVGYILLSRRGTAKETEVDDFLTAKAEEIKEVEETANDNT